LSRGATVYPFQWKGERAEEFAKERNAVLASKRSKFEGIYSLAPSSLVKIPKGLHLVLPSPNGSTLTLESAKHTTTYAGCLRNIKALCDHLNSNYKRIAVIPCGERWEDNSLRPAIEDLIAAGGIIAGLSGTKSPEAKLAEATFTSCEDIESIINACSSGIELHERGFGEDVSLAIAVNASNTIPLFLNEKYINLKSTSYKSSEK
jgi:2-phosphosulfolactate phosphatase